MWKGATPTLAFKFPFKTSTISSLTFKCDQVGTNKISKVKSDFTASGDYILYLTLSQADTLGLVDGVALTMQFKCQFTNNTVTPSAFMIMPVHEVLDKVAFAGNPASGEPAFAIDVPFPENEGVVPVMFGMAVQSNGTISWNDITGKPSTFPPSSHTHDDRYYTESEVDALLNTKQGTLTAGQNITIQDNVISASGGGGSGLPTATTAGTAAIYDGTNWIAQTGYGYVSTSTGTIVDNVTFSDWQDDMYEDMGCYYVIGLTPELSAILSEDVMDVLWGGSSYECTVGTIEELENSIYFGNPSILNPEYEDTEEPFLYLKSEDMWLSKSNSSVVVTVSGTITISGKINVDLLGNNNTKNGTGEKSVIEGGGTASGNYSHAEGDETTASGNCSHAEGYNSTSSASSAHAEGMNTSASGNSSHAEGYGTVASGYYSHAEGFNTIARGVESHVSGRYNIEDEDNEYAVIVGNGASANSRSNAFTLDWFGRAVFEGSITAPNILSKLNIANDHNEVSVYSHGDYVIYSGNLYKCTSNVQVTGQFNPDWWQQTTICAELKALFNQ